SARGSPSVRGLVSSLPVRQGERAAALKAVADEIAVCQRCRLHEGRTRAVPGEGHPSTEVAVVGEGPGFHEDQQGRPFVGAAGKLLEELLGRIGWRREEVFITNVVKCRPPENRDPEPDEIAACAPYLRRQLEALDPALAVTRGRPGASRDGSRDDGRRRGSERRTADGPVPMSGRNGVASQGSAPRPAGTPLRIIPLGGVGEIGKNMTILEYGRQIVIVDCGLM